MQWIEYRNAFVRTILWPCLEPETQTSYSYFNNAVARIHLLQLFTLLIFYQTKLKDVSPDILFVSGTVNLTYPNQMIHVKDSTTSTICMDAFNAIHSTPITKNYQNISNSIIDISNTVMVEYNDHSIDYRVNTPVIMMIFFLLSCVFQLFNEWYLHTYPNGPCFIQYIEYSISGSLTIIVMAVNVGIQDLLSIIWIFTLFLGMNLFGAIAEIMMHMIEIKESIKQTNILYFFDLYNIWLIPHICGWVLFLFAWIPVVVKYDKTQKCVSNNGSNGIPNYITVAVIFESIFYIAFGALQLYVLQVRTDIARKRDRNKQDWDNTTQYMRSFLNWWTVILSLVAKTFLAWVLMVPVLTADIHYKQS
jgi:hypothetical protein